MAETLAGLMVAMTRQNAGKLFIKAVGMPTPDDGRNAPAATCCAEVIVVSGSLSVARLSQVAAKAERMPGMKTAKAARANATLILRLIFTRVLLRELRHSILNQRPIFPKAVSLDDELLDRPEERCKHRSESY